MSLFEPLFKGVGTIFGRRFIEKQACATRDSSPFFGQSPFRTIRQQCQPQSQVELFDEMSEMEIVQKMTAR